MAGRIEQILHDLVDGLEDIQVETRQRLRRFLSSLDPVKLSDPDDVDYTASVTQGVQDIVEEAMISAHAVGYRASNSIVGAASTAGVPELRPFLQREFDLITDKITDNLFNRLTSRLDTFLRVAEQRGMDPRAALQSIERSILSVFDSKITPGPPQLNQELRELSGEILTSAVQNAGRAGQIEANVRNLNPEIDDEDIIQQAIELKLRWVCALVNTCPDCIIRHGEVNVLADWESVGMPGTGWSVCGGNCRCQLVPAELVGDDVNKLVRVRDTKTGLTVRAPQGLLDTAKGSPERRRLRTEALARAYAEDIRIRRAFRELGGQGS